jgi:hypothetical protein
LPAGKLFANNSALSLVLKEGQPKEAKMSDRLLRCTLAIALSTLKNIGTGLEMWLVDHKNTYPETLSELTPNYLRQILPGPSGTAEDWVYQRSPDGSGYSLSTRGNSFSALGIEPGLPRYHRVQGLEPPPPTVRAGLNDPFEGVQLPKSLAAEWKQRGPGSWERGRQQLYLRLTGPYSSKLVGSDWVQRQAEQHSRFEGVTIESQQQVQLGELRGIEVRRRFHDSRTHEFYLTDGELGWQCLYCAPGQEWDEAADLALVEMIESCTSHPTADTKE